MAALDRLWDDEPKRAVKPVVLRSEAAPPEVLPLLPQPVSSTRWRYGRYLGVNQLDGPDYDDAVEAADAEMVARDAQLHPVAESTHVGWQKGEAA